MKEDNEGQGTPAERLWEWLMQDQENYWRGVLTYVPTPIAEFFSNWVDPYTGVFPEYFRGNIQPQEGTQSRTLTIEGKGSTEGLILEFGSLIQRSLHFRARLEENLSKLLRDLSIIRRDLGLRQEEEMREWKKAGTRVVLVYQLISTTITFHQGSTPETEVREAVLRFTMKVDGQPTNVTLSYNTRDGYSFTTEPTPAA